jgi:hypothetical protein
VLLIVFFALVIALAVVHGAQDQASPDAPSACVGIVLVFFACAAVAALMRPQPVGVAVRGRAPPSRLRVFGELVERGRLLAVVLPLRR